jgi:predicted nucleic acid-binding protein
VGSVIVFDACVLIAHLEASDALHNRGVALMRATSRRERRIASLTRAEVRIGFERAGRTQEALNDILVSLRFAEVFPDSSWAAHVARVRVASSLRLPDAVVLAQAQRLDAQVATFDGALANAAKADGRLFEPDLKPAPTSETVTPDRTVNV